MKIRPRVVSPLLILVAVGGCAGRQYGRLLANDDSDLVGSHAAGAATWNPLVEQAVAGLLTRCVPQPPMATPVGYVSEGALGSGVEPCLGPATVAFVGVENRSAEELGDFKDQIFETIDAGVNRSEIHRCISSRMVDAALRETRLRPDSLFLPANRDAFAAVLGRQGSPVDYLLHATITSGTTDRNKTSQRDYLLTLEMVNVHTGDFVKEQAKIRKGYSKTRGGHWWNWGVFDQADG